MLILKQPSLEVKPATHWGCNLVLLSGTGNIEKGMLLVKAVFRTVVVSHSLLREVLIFTIFFIPSIVKCSLRFIIITAFLNNK